MACTAKKVIDTAIAEIGYQETPKGSNKNKYAKFIDKNYPNFYNGIKDGYAAWCDIFADYCVLVNCDSEEEAEYVLCQPKKSCGAGCSFSYDYYKAKGRVGNEAQLGAQIFFGTGKKPSHTGVVVDITDTSVITVEGNSEDTVKRHTYKKDSSRIYGYGYPRYSEASEAPIEKPSEPVAEPVEPPKSIYKVKTNTGVPLRLREKRNTSCAVLARIPNGTKVEVTDIQNGWGKVTYAGKTGYCSMTYLK